MLRDSRKDITSCHTRLLSKGICSLSSVPQTRRDTPPLVTFDPHCICHGRVRSRKRRPQRPVVQPHDMALKHGVDRQVLALGGRKQTVGWLVGPVDRQGGCVGDEPVLEWVVTVTGDELVAHLGPRQVFDPGGVGGEELARPRRHPLGHALVVILAWRDLPPQHKEHHV